MNSPILPILTLKSVVMAMSLEPPEKGAKSALYDNYTYYLPCGENLVKIGPVAPELSLL